MGLRNRFPTCTGMTSRDLRQARGIAPSRMTDLYIKAREFGPRRESSEGVCSRKDPASEF